MILLPYHIPTSLPSHLPYLPISPPPYLPTYPPNLLTFQPSQLPSPPPNLPSPHIFLFYFTLQFAYHSLWTLIVPVNLKLMKFFIFLWIILWYRRRMSTSCVPSASNSFQNHTWQRKTITRNVWFSLNPPPHIFIVVLFSTICFVISFDPTNQFLYCLCNNDFWSFYWIEVIMVFGLFIELKRTVF